MPSVARGAFESGCACLLRRCLGGVCSPGPVPVIRPPRSVFIPSPLCAQRLAAGHHWRARELWPPRPAQHRVHSLLHHGTQLLCFPVRVDRTCFVTVRLLSGAYCGHRFVRSAMLLSRCLSAVNFASSMLRVPARCFLFNPCVAACLRLQGDVAPSFAAGHLYKLSRDSAWCALCSVLNPTSRVDLLDVWSLRFGSAIAVRWRVPACVRLGVPAPRDSCQQMLTLRLPSFCLTPRCCLHSRRAASGCHCLVCLVCDRQVGVRSGFQLRREGVDVDHAGRPRESQLCPCPL